jgi:hypothetical protein
MRGLSSTKLNRRSSSTCSFCRSEEHQVNTCPHVPIIWKSLQNGTIPLEYMINVKTSNRWGSPLNQYYQSGSNWGELYKSCEKSYAKWLKKQESKTKKKRNVRVTKTCGYCKETGHTRTKCSHLDSHKKTLVKANRNFRKWFYEEYVVKQGLSTGCIIGFDYVTPEGYNSPKKTTHAQTIVTDINWDSINLFTMLDLDSTKVTWTSEIDGKKSEGLQSIREFMRSKVVMKVPSQSLKSANISYYNHRDSQALSSFGIELPLKSKSKSHRGTHHRQHNVLVNFETTSKLGYGSAYTENVRIIQRAPQVLEDNWLNGYSDQMSVIFKKFTMKQLDFFGVIEHITSWANK